LGRGGGAATSTSIASSLSQATDDEERWQSVSENLTLLLARFNLVSKIYKISRRRRRSYMVIILQLLS
jgi:hypothetical protein